MHLFKEHSKWTGQLAEEYSAAFSADFDPGQRFVALSLRFRNLDEDRSTTRTRLAISDYISEILLDFDNRILGDAEFRGDCRTSVMTSVDKLKSVRNWNANIILQVAWTRKSSYEDVMTSLHSSIRDREENNKIQLYQTDIEELDWEKSVLSIAGINLNTLDGSNTFLAKYK